MQTEKFVKKLLGENDVEAVLQRLDRLTLDEARATAAQSLDAIYALVQNMRVVMDGERVLLELSHPPIPNVVPSRWQGAGCRCPRCSGYVIAAVMSHFL
jgi:hypothetical protein